MSSISTYTGKHGDTYRAIQFVGSDRKRRSIRLGALPAKDVQDIKERIDLLEIYRKTKRAPDTDTAAWLGRMDDGIYNTLAAGGLVDARGGKPKGITLGAFLENYLGQRQALVTAGKITADTLRKETQTHNCLLDKFGADKLLTSFTCGDAEDFRNYLLTSGSHTVKRCGTEIVIFARRPLAENTTRKHCSTAGKFFRAAMRRELITRNPFDTPAVPKAVLATTRHAYIKAADAAAVMEKLPDNQWRLLFGLCRWGGLRIGETRFVTWGDVLWHEQRLRVHSPKTAHFHGRGERLIPLFPELAELFDERDAEAQAGDLYVLPFMQGKTDANLRKTMERAIKLAGVKPWPRLWHNLRGTRQNELLEAGFNRKAVCEWLGNSDAVAARHYEKLTDADWQMATAPLNAPPAEITQ
jgi:integrase